MSATASLPSCTRREAISLITACFGALLAPSSLRADKIVSYGQAIDGGIVTSLAAPGTKFIAGIFVATDCPISNRYLPLLVQLSKQFASQGVHFWLVYPNPGDTLAAVREHQKQYPAAASFSQLIAPDSRFLAQAHVHVTPEAAIFHADAISQPVLWHGRIDDRYLTFGTQRPVATRRDFADALRAVLAGQKPAPQSAPPVGCAIIPRV